VALIIVGVLSDRLRVRKPFMLIGTLGAIATLIVFLGYAGHPHTGFDTLIITSVILAVCLSLAYAPWMAAYTETVEAKNPALVGTGLALWGWILRLVVGISFIFLPLVITSVNPVVDNQPVAIHVIDGQPMQDFAVVHKASVDFASAHAAFLAKLNSPSIKPIITKLSAPGGETLANIDAASAALGKTFATLVKYQKTLKTLVVPYTAQLDYLAAHESQFLALTKGVKESPTQWKRWFWVDIAGMVVFIPTIWLNRGRWSPKKAKQDEDDHDRSVTEELERLLRAEGSAAATA
jgi:MFS family permease